MTIDNRQVADAPRAGRSTGLGQSATSQTARIKPDSPASQIASVSSNNDAYAWNGTVNANRPYGVNALNQYTSVGSASYTYDANGNLTSDGTSTFAYDAENRMTSATVGGVTSSLSYDPLGRLWRLANNSSDERYVYDGSDLVAIYSGSALAANFLFGPGVDEPISAVVAGSAPTGWFHADERGSINARTDQNGTVTAIQSYDEYGIPGSSNVTRFQYTGQMYLPAIGMHYYKARMYSPTLGRFMQTDPIGYDDGPNWYAYVGNDPVNRSDPLGLCGIDEAFVVTGGGDYAHGSDSIWVSGYCARFGGPNGGGRREGNESGGGGGGGGGAGNGSGAETKPQKEKPLWKRVACKIGNIDIGLGADGYAGLGGSVGGSIKLDLTTGQTGLDGYTAVGVGLGVEAGPTITSSASGNSIITANVITQAGGGYGVGVVGTRTLIGTNPGQNSVTIGKVGSPIGFVNGGAAIGFHTPALWDLGC